MKYLQSSLRTGIKASEGFSARRPVLPAARRFLSTEDDQASKILQAVNILSRAMEEYIPPIIDDTPESFNRRRNQRATYNALEKGKGTTFEVIYNLLQENLQSNKAIIEECDRNIPVEQFPGNEANRGKLLVRYTNEKSQRRLRNSTEEEIKEAKLIVLPGKDTGHGAGLSAISALLEQFFVVSSPEELWGKIGAKPLAFHHEIGAFESDRDSARWNEDKHYVSDEMRRFAENYIMPRFLDEEGKLLPPDKVKPLAFFTFSAGRKKAHMALNATIDILSERYDLAPEAIQHYTNSLNIVSIGHFPDYNQHRFPRFGRTVTVVGVDDLGPRPTRDIYANILQNESVTKKPFDLFYLEPEASDNVRRDVMIILGAGRLPAQYDGKANLLGHNPRCMIDAMSSTLSNQILRFIGSILQLEPEDKIGTGMESILSESKSYNPKNILDWGEKCQQTGSITYTEGEGVLLRNLRRHYENELDAKEGLIAKKQVHPKKWTDIIATPPSAGRGIK